MAAPSRFQFGWNAGPRHARIFGLAKSFTKNLDESTKIQQDEEIIGAASLVWRFARSYLPTEIIADIEKALDQHGMPHIATRHVAPSGKLNSKVLFLFSDNLCVEVGFTLIIDGKKHFFAHEPRAPPECYASREYSA